MPLDGRLERAARAIGGDGRACAKCGQSGPPFDGRDREEVLREAEREALTRPHVVEAEARTFNCDACGRPRVLLIQTVDNWREGSAP